MTVSILTAIVEMFGLFAVGLLARKLRYIDERDIGRWSRFVIDFMLPALVFHSIVAGFQAERLNELWPLPFLGFGIMAAGAAIGLGLVRLIKSHSGDTKKTFVHLCAINNYGFLPIIIVQNLWDKTALANLFFLNLGSTIGYWTIGIAILGGTDIRRALRNMITPTIVALLLALSLSVSGAAESIPPFLVSMIKTVGSAAVPLMLLLIGATLYKSGLKKISFPLLSITAARLAIIPAVTILLLHLLPVGRDVYNIALVVMIMPAAVTTTILTRRFGGAPSFAAQAAVVTTIVSIATIPVWLTIFLR
jgi:hypothetical protein